ncbi:Catalase mono-functional heme-containing protein [Rutstroemia sp. NJR-2017a BBW]|nr:Catalase mono-functional heme-containing protein [Rutstroemia sp. NJR-2017a BBW]
MFSTFTFLLLAPLITAQCPYGSNFLDQFTLNDTSTYFTTDTGTPIQENASLKAGERGPTLLEDFVFRQKIQHFDHERVPERAVHARGAGVHGTFTSYGNWSNITAASFLGAEGKQTPVFVRFSTVAGSRGSADTVRDVHGFATRFYTDEGNFDIVGNNIPVFFIQDAILFPDLIHAVKPSPANEIPQAATAHDSAWDFFSQQPSTLHTLLWAMSPHGTPRSYRHMDGFGVHTFRLVTDSGSSKLIKWHWKSKQGRASLLWEEAQELAGKNADFHRKDLWDAVEKGYAPEWELGVQVVEEEDVLKYGFDLLDPTKFLPEELVPVVKLGVMRLDVNPRNYFAETEQVMFQPAHLVRGVDFTDDPLLQGRLFSYLDTQLNRHNGPNFEQLPINRPHVPIHNNNRDGAAQNFIPLNTAAYSPNTLNSGSPKQATQSEGRGFFTTPGRSVSGKLVRGISSTFNDHWSQPRLFYNSLFPVEQQFLINAMRFELAQLTSQIVKQNVLIQLNRISHSLAVRVSDVLGLSAPEPDSTYYHDNSTAFVSVFRDSLPSIQGLSVGVLASAGSNVSLAQAAAIVKGFESSGAGVNVQVIAEKLVPGVDTTYSAADAALFDSLIAVEGTEGLFTSNSSISGKVKSTLYPEGRPARILVDGYRFGKPVGFLAGGREVMSMVGLRADEEGVYNGTDVEALVASIEEGLKKFKFLGRFALDE